MSLKQQRDDLEAAIVSFGNDYDRKIVRSIPNIYGQHLPSLKNKVVLDVGGQIGGFAVYAALHKAKKVITVEPLPRNVKHLKRNCKAFDSIKVLNGAVVRYRKGERFITSSACKSRTKHANFGHNVLRHEPSTRIASFLVESLYPIKTLLKKENPQVIKMDCEGSEHEILKNLPIPDCVEALAVEVHFYSQQHRDSWKKIKRHLLSIGFKITHGRESTIAGRGAFGTVIFQRA